MKEKSDTVEAQAVRLWRGRSLVAGLGGAAVASLCCLPQALAIAMGLSLSTAVALGGLIAYQRYFQAAGIGVALLALWWIVRRSRRVCPLSEEERRRVPTYVLGAFALGFAVLNLAVIPLLEQMPWLLAGR